MVTPIEHIDPQNPEEGSNSIAGTSKDGAPQEAGVHQVTTVPTEMETIGHAIAATVGLSIQDRQLVITKPAGARAAMDRTNTHRMGIEKKVFDLLAMLHVSDEEQRTIQRDLENLYTYIPKLHTQESHACISAEVDRMCLRVAQIINHGGADQRIFSIMHNSIERTTALVNSAIIQGHCRIYDAHTLAQCLLRFSTSTEDVANSSRIEGCILTYFPPTCLPQRIYEMNKILLAGIIGLNRSAESLEISAAGFQEPLAPDPLTPHTLREVLQQLQDFCEEQAAQATLDTPTKQATQSSGTAFSTRVRFSNVTIIRTHTPSEDAVDHFIAQQQATILALLADPAEGGMKTTEHWMQTCEQVFQGIKKTILGLITHEGNDSQTIFQRYHTAFQAYRNAPHSQDPLSFVTHYASTLQNQWVAAEKSALPSAQLHALIITQPTLSTIGKIGGKGGKGNKMISAIQEFAIKVEETRKVGSLFLKNLRLAGGSYTEKHQHNAQKKEDDKKKAVSRIQKLAETLKNPQHFSVEGTSLLREIYQLAHHLCLLLGQYVYTAQQQASMEEEIRVVFAMRALEKKMSTLGTLFPLNEESTTLQCLIEVLSLETEIDQYKVICQKNTLFFSKHTTQQDREIQEKIVALGNKIKLLRSLKEGQIWLDRMMMSLRDSALSLRKYIIYHQVYLLHAKADLWMLSEIEALLTHMQRTPDLVLCGDKPFLQKIWSFSQSVAMYRDRSVEASYEETVENNLEIYRPYVRSMLAQLESTQQTPGTGL